MNLKAAVVLSSRHASKIWSNPRARLGPLPD
jgi:hypothetical protein